MSTSRKRVLTPVLLLVVMATVITLNAVVQVNAMLSCSSTEECEQSLKIGSKCVNGFCSNPFVEGCFKSELGSRTDKELEDMAPEILRALDGRVCNSDDIKYGLEEGEPAPCLANEFDYFEIRIHNGNWESSIFVAWIMQIMSMEVLKVPVTIGLNSNLTMKSSFYSPENVLEYSRDPYAWEAMHIDVDCANTDEDCVDVMPEVWNGQVSKWELQMQEGIIEPVDGCGQVGKIGWFIPMNAAQRDDSLMSYYGLQGEENRAKLAQTFKRPTTWYEYCEEVSINNCTTPDEVAKHYPKSSSQATKYFEEGQFTGFFRMLPENNCTEYPETCTGYIAGPPCQYSTNIDAQLYWNDIVGLTPDGPSEPNKGYEYVSHIEIWRAANATKSDVIMWWYLPDATVEEFSDTDWSFQQIVLPTVTDACFNARIGVDDRCVDDITLRRGDPLGACDYEAHALQKVISSNLQKKTVALSEGSRSPGYPFLRALKVTDLETQSILKRWMEIGKDQYGNDARQAVCSWVIENSDKLLNFIPQGHPRNLDPTGSFNQGYLYTAMAVATLCFLGLLAIAWFVHHYRRTKVFVYAQENFIQIILFGFLLVVIGGFLYAVEPTDASCILRNWFTNLGFSTALAAVLVKMSTINRLMQKSKKRVKVSRRDMFVSLGFLVMIDLIFLIAWTVVSPPTVIVQLDLPEEFGTTVKARMMCRSEQFIWPYVSEIWQTLLLLVASVLAFQSRDILPEFNESRSIGTMIYSQFLFMIFRLIVFFFKGLIAPNVYGAAVSFLYTFDILFATTIYIIPKCIEAKKDSGVYNFRESTDYVPQREFNGARNSTPNMTPRINVDHNRQPFGLKGLNAVSMEVNYESEASSMSNLRGRQQRRRTSFSTSRSSKGESSNSSRNDSTCEDSRNFVSILSTASTNNDNSIKEEVQSDLND